MLLFMLLGLLPSSTGLPPSCEVDRDTDLLGGGLHNIAHVDSTAKCCDLW